MYSCYMSLGLKEAGTMIRIFLKMIQVQRQDFNGRVLTIRRDDMRAIAAILGVGEEHADRRLDDLGDHPGDQGTEPVGGRRAQPQRRSRPANFQTPTAASQANRNSPTTK